MKVNKVTQDLAQLAVKTTGAFLLASLVTRNGISVLCFGSGSDSF